MANLINSVQPNKYMGIESRFTQEQITEFRRFEDAEIDRFLRKYFPYKETKIWLPEITKEQFPSVRAETKAGLRKSIDDYLLSESGECVYISNPGKFVYESNMEGNVSQELSHLNFGKEEVHVYADYIAQSYRTFLYNESMDRFLERFKL